MTPDALQAIRARKLDTLMHEIRRDSGVMCSFDVVQRVLGRELSALLAQLDTLKVPEENVIERVIDHWFIQGGQSQFGELGNCCTADEVVSQILHRVRAQLDTLAQEQAHLQRIVEIERRAYDRLALCPDHRDKANGRCIVCVAEERERRAAADARLASLGQLVEQWRNIAEALTREANWMDGCNGRLYDPEERRALLRLAAQREGCADELAASLGQQKEEQQKDEAS